MTHPAKPLRQSDVERVLSAAVKSGLRVVRYVVDYKEQRVEVITQGPEPNDLDHIDFR